MGKQITLTVTMTEEEFDALQYSAWYVGIPEAIPFAGIKKSAAASRAWKILMREFYGMTNETKETMGDAAGIDE